MSTTIQYGGDFPAAAVKDLFALLKSGNIGAEPGRLAFDATTVQAWGLGTLLPFQPAVGATETGIPMVECEVADLKALGAAIEEATIAGGSGALEAAEDPAGEAKAVPWAMILSVLVPIIQKIIDKYLTK